MSLENILSEFSKIGIGNLLSLGHGAISDIEWLLTQVMADRLTNIHHYQISGKLVELDIFFRNIWQIRFSDVIGKYFVEFQQKWYWQFVVTRAWSHLGH